MKHGYVAVDGARLSVAQVGPPFQLVLSPQQSGDERRSELKAILASVDEAIVVVDDAAAPLAASAGYDRLIRAAGGELSFLDHDGEVVAPLAMPLQRAARAECIDLELTLVGPDGERRPFQAAVRPTGLVRTSEPIGVVTFRDLGERQTRLLQEQFLALVAHELRAPLSGIRGYAELLSSYFDDPPAVDVQAVAQRVHCLVERLDLMLGDLLDVARISSGKLRIRRTMFDLRAIVVAATELARARPDAPIISMELPSDAIVLEIDPGRLSDVVLNLLTNAIKHATGATRIDARLMPTSDGAVIEVEDNGSGIPPDHLPLIFSRHYQVLRGDDSGDVSDGLGLGLFIAQQTVSALGGRLDVESTLGVGTRFSIRLPYAC